MDASPALRSPEIRQTAIRLPELRLVFPAWLPAWNDTSRVTSPSLTLWWPV